MYEQFYGFSEKPFQMAPNPHFLYLTDRHKTALTLLEYGLLERAGFILLTGEVGAGKTTLIRHIHDQMDGEIIPAVIFNTNVTAEQLLRLIMQEYELAPTNSKAENLDLLSQFLVRQFAAGKRALLIIDEAQNLSDEALEEVRMFFNLQSDDQVLLQIILVGQPELKRRIRTPRLAQLRQRIAVSFHLTSLSREETGAYIAARLERAGGPADLFAEEAVSEIYQASGGIPRTINIICDAALVYGFADERRIIRTETVAQVLEKDGGLCLAAEPVAGEEPSMPPVLADNRAQGSTDRLLALEKQLHALQIQLDAQQEQFTEKAHRRQAELIKTLVRLLKEERAKSDGLLQKNILLRQKYKLLERAAAPKAKPLEAAEPEPERLKIKPTETALGFRSSVRQITPKTLGNWLKGQLF